MAIFISYSRRDTAFVRRLHEGLAVRQRETWVDWEGIPPSADWMREIEAAIDGAQALVFVLSPDSLQSAVCRHELEHAVARHKRLLPVVAQDAGVAAVPEALARLNWIFLRDADDFETGLDRLIQAIDTDLEWVQAHTRLIVRAAEWEARGFEGSLLLRGADLVAAEAWLTRGPDQDPQPTAAQTRYIIESRRMATRRRTQLLGGVAVAIAAVTVLGTLSWTESRQAERQQTIAQARRLAAAAERTRELPVPEHASTAPHERSLQMATEAVRRLGRIGERSLEADLAVRRALALAAEPVVHLLAHRQFFERDVLRFVGEDELLVVSREPSMSMRLSLLNGERIAGTEAQYEHNWWSIHVDAGNQWVAYSSGTQLASGEGVVELRNTRNMATVARWGGLPGISDVAVGPGGLLAIVLSTDKDGGQTRLHAALAERPVVTLPPLTYPVFSRDGRWFAANTGTGYAIWSVEALLAGRAEPAHRYEVSNADWIEFLDGDRGVITHQGDPEGLALRNLSGQGLREWKQKNLVSVSPDGRLWLVRERGYALTRILDAGSGAEIARLPSRTPDAPFAWSPDSRQLALADGDGIGIWRLPVHGSAQEGADVGEDALALAFAPEEDGFLTLHRRGEGDAARWFVERRAWGSPRRVSLLDLGPAAQALAFSADGARLSLGAPGPLEVYDLVKGDLLYEGAASAPAAAVALSPNGRYAAALAPDGRLTALEVDGGRVVAQAARAASAVGNLLAVSDDGRTLVAVNADGNFRVGASQSLRRWTADAMASPASQPIGQKTSGLAAQVCGLSGSGDAVAINTSGSALRVRDTRTGRDLATVDEAGARPLCAFSADGRLLATSGVDETLRIWDLARQEEIARMELRARPLAFAFSRTGRWVAALDERGVVRRWPLQAADLVAQVCTRLRTNLSAADWSRFMPAEDYRPTCEKLPVAPVQRQ